MFFCIHIKYHMISHTLTFKITKYVELVVMMSRSLSLLLQEMAWRQIGAKPFHEAMLISDTCT